MIQDLTHFILPSLVKRIPSRSFALFLSPLSHPCIPNALTNDTLTLPSIVHSLALFSPIMIPFHGGMHQPRQETLNLQNLRKLL